MNPLQRRSLRARIFAVLSESCIPMTTTELALLTAFKKPNRDIRVLQVLKRQEQKGRVLRLPPIEPLETRTGRRAWRWALTPDGFVMAVMSFR